MTATAPGGVLRLYRRVDTRRGHSDMGDEGGRCAPSHVRPMRHMVVRRKWRLVVEPNVAQKVHRMNLQRQHLCVLGLLEF